MEFSDENITLMTMAFTSGFVFHMIFSWLYSFLRNPLLGVFLYKDDLVRENKSLVKYNRMLKDDMREEVGKRQKKIDSLKSEIKEYKG